MEILKLPMPREKFFKQGIGRLKDYELIAIILSTGIKGEDVISLSKKVVRIIQLMLYKESIIEIQKLLNIAGIGKVKALKIIATIELGKRLFQQNLDKKVFIQNTKQAYEEFKYLKYKKQENLIALYLDSRYSLLLKKTLYIGNHNKISIIPRDIIAPALETNASFIILAHNHPSGDSTPSTEDINVNNRIKESCEIMGVELLDHLIIGDDNYKTI